ncbi:uncharacterized protein At3g49055 [Punica granatum]|uniref:Paramyosin n=2 Tax=Punica granatum TaxID=22663 RepID=A0A218WU82_PUNGR|nr:uncharacterized protein At3g49055 [Punica granatum]OWM76136.1 hypothetical protein CDL15_Pgr009782 [Punica granatum]PKI77105.1 hypothetical protein CRG98_002608 [Punica granatum]
MAAAGDEDPDAVLSDVEGDDPVPITISEPSPEDLSVERFRELMTELDRERQARAAAENSKSELQVQFGRLKALAHEAIKKRDQCTRERDEALREKEELLQWKEKISAELEDASRVKDDALSQKDQIARQLDETVKSKDNLKSEIESSAHMLVTGIEKISGKVSNFKNFSAGGLPRSQKYTGLAAIAYGVIKRTNEIVEELVRQVNVAEKSRNEAREQMEQRNYEIAIEVSQLEAAISRLKEEVAKKSGALESLEKAVGEKDETIADTERVMMEKVNLLERENSELKEFVGEIDDKLNSLESRMEMLRPFLIEQLDFVTKIHEKACDVIKIVDASNSDQSDLSGSLFLPQDTDVEENIHASLAGTKSIYELMRVVVEKTKDLVDEKNLEIKGINETVDRLVKEKEQIGSLLRSALSKRMALDPSSRTNELLQVAENGLREAGIEFKFSKHLGDKKASAATEAKTLEKREDEIYTLAGALENIIKESQLEIIDQRHCIEELRAELSSLKQHVEAQVKELNNRKLRIEELEEKERVANESIEGLMMDIASAEEEIARWKGAAEQEAAAGGAVEQELTAQLATLKQELEEAKQAMLEFEKKLKFKEETAAAAMAARDAAEKSLRLADLRASRLRDRVEELTHQLEESESQRDARRSRNGPRYVCWPWQWLGLDFVGIQRSEAPQQSSNEMELSEPFL